jgi:hypothetical protein
VQVKLSEVHLIHPAPEPGPSRNVFQWYSVERGYDLALTDAGIVITKGGLERVIPMSNVIAYERAKVEVIAHQAVKK